MKNISMFLSGALLALFAALPCSAGTTIEGELVVIDGHPSQFRIVDQPGQFSAPGGVSLEALDGKPVIVELSDKRQVLRITEKQIAINPITHEYETIVGELVVVDAARGSFTIAGNDRTYVAPRSIDPSRYAGRRVEVFLGKDGEVRQIQLAQTSLREQPTDLVPTSTCSYAGRGYSQGESLCQEGTQYRCEGGSWRSLGVACEGLKDHACDLAGVSYSNGAARCENGVRFVCDDGRWQYSNAACGSETAGASRSSRTCVVGSATVAPGSSICRDGVTFRCTDGDWIDAGRACR